MSSITFVFWLSLFMVLYVYGGYPLLVFFLSRLIYKPVKKRPITPTITILIAAYNEEDCIANTLENKLSLDYPPNKLEIIVVSDASEDKTDQIVKRYAHKGVKLIRQSPRAGKTSALNLAVPHASGDILIFSDANSIYELDALQKLVSNFADETVGYVTGKMIYSNPDGTTIGDGCSAYMKYENWIRKHETLIGSVVGVDGGIDAIRKKLYTPLRADQLPDFVQPLKVVEKGFRVVYEPAAILREAALKEGSDEYRMRVRVSLRALWALYDMRNLLAGKGGTLFAWQLWSHKVLRYMCFIFLTTALLTNIWLATEYMIYQLFLIPHFAIYVCAGISPLLNQINVKLGLVRISYYFVLLNIASLHAVIKFVQGKKQVIWSPRKG